MLNTLGATLSRGLIVPCDSSRVRCTNGDQISFKFARLQTYDNQMCTELRWRKILAVLEINVFDQRCSVLQIVAINESTLATLEFTG